MEALKALMIIALLPPAIIAGPMKYAWDDVGPQCSSHCIDRSNLKYTVGHTFRYSYEVKGVSSLDGASDQSSSVLASAHVDIHVLSKCEFALTLTDVTFKTSEPDSSYLRDVGDIQYASLLEENPLHFSFQDGRIDKLCPSEGERKEILNFKRGVLSAFQNSMTQHNVDQSLREIDVSGNCPTDYVIVQKGTRSSEIIKTKDLLGCTEREHFRTSLQSTPFHVPEAIQSFPLLKGDLKCTIVLRTPGIFTDTICTESLIFRPFSKKESGAKTETTQKLKFIFSAQTYQSVSADWSRTTSLIFENVQAGNTIDETMWSVRDKILDLCKSSQNGISKETPGLFTELVYLMKQVPTDDIDAVFRGVESYLIPSEVRAMGVKYFLDALPMVGTEGSVNLMVDLIFEERVRRPQVSVWIQSIGFLQQPNSKMLKIGFKKLLTSHEYRMEALLPISSAVHSYCRNQINCESQTEVKDIVFVLRDILGNDCSGPLENENVVLSTLRAAGNLGYSDSLEPTLINCLRKNSNSMSIRVASVEAFRAVRCNPTRTVLMDVFMNKDEDSELRINAYLAQMMCPSQMLLQKIKRVLEGEEINQVGSFVWTHLTNLAETSNPYKQDVKEILQDEKLQKEFDLSRMKFSRNYELSYFSKKFGSGATAESNLIWSSSSFLPRSATVNLTVDVLGHSMNLFEVGCRVQGLQQVLHDFIGNKIKDYKNKGKDENPKSCGKKSKMDDMKAKHGVQDDELSGSIYLRMFGKELDFKHFTKTDLVALADKFNPKQVMASLSQGNDISFSRSIMFLDSTMTVPTIGGMALQLSVNGTASFQLKASGKLDLHRMSMKKMEVDFNFEPSAAVEIGGQMTLNAGVMKSGLKMMTTLHSNVAYNGRLDLSNGQILTIKADTPRERMDVLNLQSEFFVVHTNAVKQQKPLESKAVVKQGGCSDKIWLTTLGYEMCTEISYTNDTMLPNAPYWPLVGPSSIQFVLHKRDAPQGFKLTAERIHKKASMLGRLSIDSPGSKVDRNLAANYFIDTKAYSVEMEVTSPWKKALVKGSYTNNLPKSLKMSGSVGIDQQMYDLSFKLDKDMKDGKTIWTPLLQMERPKDSPLLAVTPQSISIGGPISLSKKMDDISANLDLVSSIQPNPLKLQLTYINKKTTKTLSGAVIENKKKVYSASFQMIQSFGGKNDYPTKIKPTILISFPKWRPFLLSANIDYKKEKIVKSSIQLQMENTLKDPIDLTFKVIKAKSKYRGSCKLTSQFGTIKSKGYVDIPTGSSSRKSPLLTSKITTSYNLPVIQTRALRKNIVVFNAKVHDRSSTSLMKYDANLILESRKYQAASFVVGAQMSHKNSYTKTAFTYQGGAKSKISRDKKKQLKVETTLNHKINATDVDIRYDMQILYPIKSIEWQINGKHEHDLKKLSIETYNSFIYAKGKSSEIRFKIDDNSKNRLEYNGILEFNYPTFEFRGRKIKEFSYKMDSSLQEKANKEYAHSFQIFIDKNLEHSIYSKYKILKEGNKEDPMSGDYTFNSKIYIHEKHKSKISFSTTHIDKKTEMLVKINRDGKHYKIDMTRDMKGTFYSNDWDIVWPTRRVKGMCNFGMVKQGQHSMAFSTLWDANKDLSKKVEIDFNQEIRDNPNDVKYDLELSVRTPIEGYQVFAYKRMFENNDKEMKDELKLILQQEDHEFSYKFWLMKPFSLQRLHTDFELITPLHAMRMFRVEVRHKSSNLNVIQTSIKSKHNYKDVAFDILFSNKQYKIQNRREYKLELEVKGAKRNSLEFKIGDFPENLSFKPLSEDLPKRMKLGFIHDDNGRQYDSEFVFYRDNSESKLDLHTTYLPVGKMINLKSDMNIKLPNLYPETISFALNHMNSLTNLNTTLSSKWAKDKRAKLDVGATVSQHDQTLYLHYSGTTERIFDWIYKIHHNSFQGYSGSSFSELNKNPSMRSTQTYKITETELSYESTDPQSKSLIKLEYDNFPYTGYMKFDFIDSEDQTWKDITVSSSVDKNKERDWTGDLQLVTPFEKVRNINVKGTLKDAGQNQWELNGDIDMGVKDKIELKVNVDVEKWSKIEAEVKNPWKDVSFNIMHKKNKRGMKTEVKTKYDGKEIVGKLSGKLKVPGRSNLALDLTTPFEILPSASLKGNLNNKDNKWTGNVELKTANKDFKLTKVEFDHFYDNPIVETGVMVTSSMFDKVDIRTRLNWNEDSDGLIKIVAPEIGQNSFGFERLSSTAWTDFHYRYYGEVQGKEFDMDLGLKHGERLTKMWSTFAIPGADKSYFKTSMHRIGDSLMDFDIGGDLQLGKNTVPFNASAQFSYIEGKTTIGTTFTSPFTKGFSYLLSQEVSKTGQTSTIYGKYGNDYMLDIYDMVDLHDSSYVAARRTGYLLHGEGHTQSYNIKVDWSDKGEELEFEYKLDDDVIKAVGNHVPQSASSDDQDTVDLLVTTPYENFKELELHSYVEMLYDGNYEGKLSIEYMDDKEAELIFDVKQIRNKIIGNGELTLPEEGYEKIELHYTQIHRRGLVSVDAEAVTPNGDTLKANMKLKNDDSFVLSLSGPIKEFESFKITGRYNEKDQQVKGDVKLWLNFHPTPVNLDYNGQVNEDNLFITLKLKSPYENFRQADLSIDHTGFDLMKFSTTTKFSLESLGKYELTNNWNFESPALIEGKVSISTPDKEYKLFMQSSSEKEHTRKSQFQLSWDSDKEIILKTSWEADIGYYGMPETVTANLDMITPFEDLKTLDITFSESNVNKKYSRSISVKLNEVTYLDTDMKYYLEGNTHKASLEMRKPSEMSIDIEGQQEDRTFDGKIFLHWDKQSQESKFEFNLHFADKSQNSNIDTDFYIKLIHPVRIMAVEYLIRKADKEMQSSGLVTWDESKGNTFSYDIGYTDRSSLYSSMYSAHVKVGVPHRSVKLLGSYGDTGTSRTMTGTALWDADKDESKKVSVSTSHEYSERNERFSLNLNLPSINKQMNVGVVAQRMYGTSILDSKTEITYSSDPRKTLIITNKIYDSLKGISGKGNYNYTLVTGFKHAITDTDVEWLSHYSKLNSIKSVGSQFTYLALNRVKKVFSLRAQSNGDKSGQFMFVTPVKSINLVGKSSLQEGQPTYIVKLFEDGSKTLAFTGKVLPDTKQFDATLHYDRDDPRKKMHMNAAYVSDRSLELSVYDDQHMYAKINSNLNSSRIIHNRVLWKPSFPEEFKMFLRTKVTTFSYAAKDSWDSTVKNIGTEVKAKYLKVSEELREEIGQVFALMRKEMKIFSKQLEMLSTSLRRMYARNDLNIRDLGKQFDEALQEVLAAINKAVINYQHYYMMVSKSTANWIADLKKYPIAAKYQQFISDAMAALDDARKYLENVLKIVAMGLSNISDSAYQQYVKIARVVDRKLNSYTQSKEKLAIYKQMIRERMQLANMGADYNTEDMKQFDHLLMKFQQVLEDQFHDMMGRIEFQHAHAMVTEIYQQFKYWKSEQGFGQAVTRLLDLSKNLFLMELGKLKNILMDMKKSQLTYYDPIKAELQFELYLPIELESFSQPPEFEIGRSAKDTYKWLKSRFMPGKNISLLEMYQGYIPSLKTSDWLPPFEATGYLIGSQHIITFDKTDIDYINQCSHVLVRDMLYDSFSVIVNYDKKQVKSLCFNFDNSLSLEVSNNYQLTVNRQATEMPFVNEMVRVVREGNTISVRYVNGLEVVTNPQIDVHKVVVSGWFHGRVAGLLGFYDNEKQNDKEIEDSLRVFEVNRKSCNSRNAVKPTEVDIEGTCTQFFGSEDSPFEDCYKEVNPAGFLRLCQLYTNSMEYFNEVINKVSKQYRSVCRDNGIYLDLPSEYPLFCVNYEGNPIKSADVLFVVEDAQCNMWTSKFLTRIVTEMNSELTKDGASNNRFGLIGYNGEDVTVSTIQGQHFGKADLFLRAVETLRFESPDVSGDLVSALQMAIKYPFRATVPTKMLIVVPCLSCEQLGILNWGLYADLQQLGFQIHTLQELNFLKQRDERNRPMTVYGMDQTNIMTNRGKYIKTQDKITIPSQDECQSLTQQSLGYSFDSVPLKLRNRRTHNDFIKTFAMTVSKERNKGVCNLCVCNPDTGKASCGQCDRE